MSGKYPAPRCANCTKYKTGRRKKVTILVVIVTSNALTQRPIVTKLSFLLTGFMFIALQSDQNINVDLETSSTRAVEIIIISCKNNLPSSYLCLKAGRLTERQSTDSHLIEQPIDRMAINGTGN